MADAIQPRRVVPWRLPAQAMAASVPLAISLGLALSPPLEPSTRGMVVEQDASSSDQGVSVVEVRRAANLLASRAERERDSYQQVLAQSLEVLARDVEFGRVTDEEAQRQLRRILDHVAQSLGLSDETAFGTADGVGFAQEESTLVRPATPREGGRDPVEAGRGDEPIAAADRVPEEDELTLEGLLERLEIDALAQAEPSDRQDLDSVNFREGTAAPDQGLYFDNPELDRANARILEAARRRAEARGAPDEARAGPGGDGAAGADQQPLFTDEPAALEGLGAETEFTLPWQDRSPGRRVQVLLAPQENTAGGGRSLLPDEEWSRQPEAPVPFESVPVDALPVIERYFLSSLEAAGQE